MKIYVVMVEDRHADPEVSLFSTADAAITYARNLAIERAKQHPAAFEERVPDGDELYYAVYTVEDDCVWVIEKELDQPDHPKATDA